MIALRYASSERNKDTDSRGTPFASWHFGRGLAALVVILNALACIAAAFSMHKSYAHYERQAEVQTQNLAQAIDQSIGNLADKIDLSLHSLVFEIERELTSGGISQPALRQMALLQKELLPGTKGIRVIDASGNLIEAGSEVPNLPSNNLADRPYFQALKNNPQAGMLVSKALLSRFSQERVIVFARRFNQADGNFAGVVSIPLSLAYLKQLISQYEAGDNSLIALRDSDSDLLARYRKVAGLVAAEEGDPQAPAALQALIASARASGTYRDITPADGLERVFSFRRVAGVPILVVAGIGKADYLERWHQELQEIAAALAVFLLLSLVFAQLVYKLWRRHLAAAYSLRESYEFQADMLVELETRDSELNRSVGELRLAHEAFLHSHESFVITDIDTTILEVNPAFTAMTGYSPEEVIGKSPNILQSGRHTPEFYGAMWHTLLEQGYWEGEFVNKRKDGRFYTQLSKISAIRDGDGQIIRFLSMAADVTQARSRERYVEHMAFHDRLTDLPNRYRLDQHLQEAIARVDAQNGLLGVCYVDLDGFKQINDVWGRDTGDLALIEIAGRLQKAVKPQEVVARLGGDEFVILLGAVAGETELEQSVKSIMSELAAPLRVAASEFSLTASIGVATYPDDIEEPDQLIRRADQAMCLAKRAGKNRCQFFDAATERRLKSERELFQRLHQALEQEEFCLYYQPKVNMRSGAVIGVEALIRWQHPERGIVAPAEFLPSMENSELSLPLGEWVLRTALRQNLAWAEQGLRLPVSVNIAGEHLQRHDFDVRLAAILGEFPGVEPAMLELEILETSDMSDIDAVSRVISACSNLGVRFALDDFGTGFSSLTYFRRLPTQTLKLDQSFVRDMLRDADDLALVEGIIALANSFRREVIAEGVETIEHGIPLMRFGCYLAQGYGIARPLPAAQIPQWVAAWRLPVAWRLEAELLSM